MKILFQLTLGIAEEPNKEDSAYKDIVTLKWCTPKANNQHGIYTLYPSIFLNT